MRSCLFGRDIWSTFVRSLPLTVADQPDLQAQVVSQREGLRQRIVEVHGFARMNIGALLRPMEFIQLEGRDSGRFVFTQVKGLA
jgi:hypothetical protein